MSTTTTTARPGGRPPADKIINEVFFDKKCATKEPDRTEFFRWCASAGPSVRTTCSSIGGSAANCPFTAEFINLGGSYDDNGAPQLKALLYQVANDSDKNGSTTPDPSMTTTVTPPYSLPPIKPGRYALVYNLTCDMGPGKETTWSERININKTVFESLTETCYQELYGKPYNLPWWLILLIILLVIAAVGIAFTLFWRLWLRPKLYARKGRRGGGISSQYTSAPFSSASSANISRPSVRGSQQPRSSNMSRSRSGSRQKTSSSRAKTSRR